MDRLSTPGIIETAVSQQIRAMLLALEKTGPERKKQNQHDLEEFSSGPKLRHLLFSSTNHQLPCTVFLSNLNRLLLDRRRCIQNRRRIRRGRSIILCV